MYLFTIGTYMFGAWLASEGAATPSLASPDHVHRLGLLLMLTTSWATVLLAGALYASLRVVDATLALFALLWRTGEAALGALIVALRFVALQTDAGAAGGQHPIGAGLDTLIDATCAVTFNVVALFFTAGSTLFFWLFLTSRFIPRALSVFGLIASLLFAMLACANLLQFSLPGLLRYAWAPILLAEIATGVWLFVRGVDASRHGDANRARAADSGQETGQA
jgi:hypothetical protein